MPAATVRVLCVEDHPIVRDGIAFIINRQPDLEVVGAASTGEEAVSLFRALRPDITLMDLQLPGMSGLEAIRMIRRENPDARIIVLSSHEGDVDIQRALKAGAQGYVAKGIVRGEPVIDAALREIRRSIGLCSHETPAEDVTAILRNIVAAGFDRATVERVLRMVHGAEFKRKQAAPGLKVTDRAFGTGWRMPIAARLSEGF